MVTKMVAAWSAEKQRFLQIKAQQNLEKTEPFSFECHRIKTKPVK